MSLVKPKSAEILDLKSETAETENLTLRAVNPQTPIGSEITDYLERIEAKIDLFQSKRRPSIVDIVQAQRIHRPEMAEIENAEIEENGESENRESDYESDDGQPKKESSPGFYERIF